MLNIAQRNLLRIEESKLMRLVTLGLKCVLGMLVCPF